MIPYWLLFAFPAILAVFEAPSGSRRADLGRTVFLPLTLLAVTLMVGLRYEVGVDWGNYIAHLRSASNVGLNEFSSLGDPGYVLINWLIARAGGDIWQVNLICGALFSVGLFTFCRAQPRPWLALAVAVPYLVIVIAMGYTRQGVAIGLAMMGMVALGQRRSTLWFVFWIVLAATFHKSAVVLLAIAALTAQRGRWWTVLWTGAATIVAYVVFLEHSVGLYLTNYIDAEYQSDGAAIRVAMNVVPAVLFLVFRNWFIMEPRNKRLWMLTSSVALFMIPALIVSPSSTAVDRMALYIIPLQLLVFSRLPDALGRAALDRRVISIVVVIYSTVVLAVWLNFASHAFAWLPYRIYPF